MAQLFRNRTGFRPDLQARQDLIGTVRAGLGQIQQKFDELDKAEGIRQETNARLSLIEEFSSFDTRAADNAANPDEHVGMFDDDWDTIQKTVMLGVDDRGKQRVIDMLNAERIKKRIRVRSNADKQIRVNIETDHSRAVESISDPRSYLDPEGNPDLGLLTDQLIDGINIIDNGADAGIYPTEKTVSAAKKEFKFKLFSGFILQLPDAEAEKALANPDKYFNDRLGDVGELEAEVFSPSEITKLKSDYNRQKSARDTTRNDEFDDITGKTALDWDVKLQAWDDPTSENKLTYAEINVLRMPGFEDEFGNDIVKFKELWRGLLDSKIKSKKTGDNITPVSAMFEAEMIIRSLGSRRMTLVQAINAYNKIAPDIKSTDNKSYISRMFGAEEKTRVPAKQVLNGQLVDRQRKLKDAIEQQPNFLIESEGREILQDLANQAQIELGDKYGDLEWENIKDVDAETDRLIRKYTPSVEALNIMVLNKQIEQAETFEAQQEEFQKMHESLLKQNKNAEADLLLEQMIEEGIAEKSGKPSKGKEKVSGGALRRILDNL